MSAFKPSLVHALVTPFDANGRVDYAALTRLVDFHIANGAGALATPMHVGEAVSLPDAEKREVIAATIKAARGRVPVIAHASDSGTGLAAALARFAEQAGAVAVVSATPYYWTPPPHMLVEHFAQIAAAVKVPFFVHNAPDDMAGIKVNVDMMLKLIERAPNLAGVVDSGLDWQFMIELMTYAPEKRAGFQLLTGIEYVVSAAAIGSTGTITSLAGIAPKMIGELHRLCLADKLVEARQVQADVAALRAALKGLGVAGVKNAMAAQGRDVGLPRPPLQPLSTEAARKLAEGIAAIAGMKGEPRGW